ncbi:MAG: TIGR04283 family arsenosugar biosynthesis glycosyltransferase, partial [Candidatus Krumholzibacteria bacterium]|nr:TIGR04283 family arsenosugar biosynthesis glycosyltransferase [Candidatus Krumholzibacteria bacterium]
YGAACLAGIAAARDADILVFMDGDHSDHAEQIERLLAPIREQRADMVIGSRALGRRERGAMPPQARIGNLVAVTLMRWLFGARYTDLGPFRAITRDALDSLCMSDRGYGWTVEMQLAAARRGLSVLEVPVDYRRRVGRSKISGTVSGTIAAGAKILFTVFRHALRRAHAHPRSKDFAISVVVPTLNEADALPRCLSALDCTDERLQVIVADGGSTDGTLRIAASFERALVVSAPAGRAGQMNAGAKASRGEALWFLHADCRPPCGAPDAIRRALADPRVAGGAFGFALDGPGFALRVLELGVRLRCLLFRLPYGDQGLFVRRSVFEGVGGFQEIPAFEDVRLVRAIKKRGRLALLPARLPTSPRRWRRDGVIRTTARHLAMSVMERLGASPERLASWREPRAGNAPAHDARPRETGRTG